LPGPLRPRAPNSRARFSSFAHFAAGAAFHSLHWFAVGIIPMRTPFRGYPSVAGLLVRFPTAFPQRGHFAGFAPDFAASVWFAAPTPPPWQQNFTLDHGSRHTPRHSGPMAHTGPGHKPHKFAGPPWVPILGCRLPPFLHAAHTLVFWFVYRVCRLRRLRTWTSHRHATVCLRARWNSRERQRLWTTTPTPYTSPLVLRLFTWFRTRHFERFALHAFTRCHTFRAAAHAGTRCRTFTSAYTFHHSTWLPNSWRLPLPFATRFAQPYAASFATAFASR